MTKPSYRFIIHLSGLSEQSIRDCVPFMTNEGVELIANCVHNIITNILGLPAKNIKKLGASLYRNRKKFRLLALKSTSIEDKKKIIIQSARDVLMIIKKIARYVKFDSIP